MLFDHIRYSVFSVDLEDSTVTIIIIIDSLISKAIQKQSHTMKTTMGKLLLALGIILTIGSAFLVYTANAEQTSKLPGSAINSDDSSSKIDLNRFKRQYSYAYQGQDSAAYPGQGLVGKQIITQGIKILKKVWNGVLFGAGEKAASEATQKVIDTYRQSYPQQQPKNYQSYYGK